MNYSLTKRNRFSIAEKSVLNSIVAVIIILAVLAVSAYFLYHNTSLDDWRIFANAARTVRPYNVADFFNTPFGLPILLPFSILPYQLGGTLWNMVSLSIVAFCVIKLSMDHKILRLVLAFTFVPIIAYLDMGQICALSLLSVTMLEKLPRSNLRSLYAILGLFKPNLMGAAIAVFWLDSDKREKAIFLAVFLASFVVYGLWILDMIGSLAGMNQDMRPNNLALLYWPGSIIVGIPVFLYGLKTKSYFWTAVSTPLFMPYFNAYSLFPFFAYIFARRNIGIAIILYLLIQTICIIRFVQVLS